MAVKTYCSRVVSYLKKGPAGPQGNTGRMAVPYGTYGTPYEGATSPLTYVCTDRVAPMVYYKASGATTGYYYVMVRNTTWVYGTNTDPQTDYVNNSPSGTNTWARLQTVDYFFTKLLMADFGKIASAVFYGSLMFSQQGVTGSDNHETSDYSALHVNQNTGDVDESGVNYFRPNFWVNFLDGKLKARNADIAGKITATSGTIGGLNIASDHIGITGTTPSESDPSPTGNGVSLYSHYMQFNRSTTYYDASLTIGANTNTSDNYRESIRIWMDGKNYTSSSFPKTAYGLNISVKRFQRNIAIGVSEGMCTGIRPYIRAYNDTSSSAIGVYCDGTINDPDAKYAHTFVISNNNQSALLYLPTNPKDGDEILILHTVAKSLWIRSNGRPAFFQHSNEVIYGSRDYVNSGSREACLCVYSASTKVTYNNVTYTGCWICQFYHN